MFNFAPFKTLILDTRQAALYKCKNNGKHTFKKLEKIRETYRGQNFLHFDEKIIAQFPKIFAFCDAHLSSDKF